MKILTPLNSIEQMYRLFEAGADEFYMGFSDPEWNAAFGPFADLNRLSSYGSTANQEDSANLASCIENAHRLGASLYVTFNAACYDDEQLEWFGYYMDAVSGYGADGVIIGTPEQAVMAAERGLPAVAGTMCAVYNSDIAAFYADLGVNRSILPRDLSTDTIREIASRVPEVEYEVFLMRNGCRYSDSYCLGLHGGTCGGLCFDQSLQRPDIVPSESADEERIFRLEENSYLYESVFHRIACGQCALWRFLRAGISAVKIVGRMDDAESVAGDVQLTRYNLAVAEDCGTETEYLRNMAMPDRRFGYCAAGLSCYYPEVRFR